MSGKWITAPMRNTRTPFVLNVMERFIILQEVKKMNPCECPKECPDLGKCHLTDDFPECDYIATQTMLEQMDVYDNLIELSEIYDFTRIE
jgi:hypothetical protein